ncbi:MAG: EamA family transporter [candidate division Zixibacteria bacterium CG_4_9_14_3_um_filter_46_8]|nr:MAG: EamA family transporter [candidate division Zixibacteria bacterium CG_4_9_14_3_um_filter_46_8]
MDHHFGEFAALATAICWAFTSIFFTISSSRVGALVVNTVRLAVALLLLTLTHLAIFGQIIPAQAAFHNWLWLGISAIIGLVIGNSLLFKAFVVMGTRLSMLLMSLVPIIGAITAFFLFKETLSIYEILASLITIGGISWVIMEKGEGGGGVRLRGKPLIFGLLLCIGGAAGQAFGLIASRIGMEGNLPALSANLIRMLTATILMWTMNLLSGRVVSTIRKLRDVKATAYLFGGAMFGPFIGVWLSLIAISHAKIGIASTLMSVTPILLLPLSHWIYKEEISIRAVIGTFIAVAGVAILFLL